MAVAVFGQLDHLLRERNLAISDLRRQIEERDGSAIDAAALELLASGQRLPQIDPTAAGAVAGVLGVPLDDLLLVVRIPHFRETGVNLLSEEETWRLWALLSLQQRRELSDAERADLESIVDEHSRNSDEFFWRKEAQRRGVPFEALKSEFEEDQRYAKAMRQRDWSDKAGHPAERAAEPRTSASR